MLTSSAHAPAFYLSRALLLLCRLTTLRSLSCSAVIASFGGLLMSIVGDQRHVVRISLDQKVYCLVRKAGGGR